MPNSAQYATSSRRKSRLAQLMAGAVLVAAISSGCGVAAQNGQASTKPQQTSSTSSTSTSTGTSTSSSTTNSTTSTQAGGGTSTSTSTAKTLPDSAVIATFKGGTVTKGQYDTMYNTIAFLAPIISPGSGSPTKDQFINQYVAYFRYLFNMAEKDATVKSKATSEVNQGFPQFLTQLTAQFSSKKKLDAQLKTAGITETDLKNYMYDDAVLSAYLQKSLAYVKVSTADVNAYIAKNRLKYTQVNAAHILVKSLKTANMIEQKLKAGASFAAMAKKYSIDGSKSNGGVLGAATLDSYVTPFANACLTLPLNTISKPVHSQYGYHIIKVLSRTVLTTQAQSDLLSQKQQAAEGPLLAKVQKDAQVKVTAKSNQL